MTNSTPATAAPWTAEQEREALSRVLAELDKRDFRSRLDVPTVVWGASMALVRMRQVLNGE